MNLWFNDEWIIDCIELIDWCLMIDDDDLIDLIIIYWWFIDWIKLAFMLFELLWTIADRCFAVYLNLWLIDWFEDCRGRNFILLFDSTFGWRIKDSLWRSPCLLPNGLAQCPLLLSSSHLPLISFLFPLLWLLLYKVSTEMS